MTRSRICRLATCAVMVAGLATVPAAAAHAATTPAAPVLSGSLVNSDSGTSANDARLTWTAVSGATSYTLRGRNTAATSGDASYKTVYAGSARSYTFPNQVAGDLYKWQVYANNPATKAPLSLAVYLDTAGVYQPSTGGSGWNLRFDDEFNGTTLDTVNWTPFWFHDGDVQNNTHQSASNVAVSGGSLQLTLKSATSGATVSANPNGGGTGHGYQHSYGYVQMRMFIPAADAVNAPGKIADWGAGWETGQNWPATGEHDIVEGGDYPSYHVWYGSPGSPASQGSTVPGNYAGAWHTFAADWEPSSLTFYYDSKQVGQVTGSAVLSSPLYPLFTVGAGAPGGVAVPGSVWKVDYLRIWQHAGQS